MTAAGAAPRTVLVCLGASNLTLGLTDLLRAALPRLAGPAEILVAAGHGRSYGSWSRVGIWGLPGILQCGLWEHLPDGTGRRALLTDIGNDLAYGASPARVAEWADECLGRLGAGPGRAVLTLLPRRSLEALPPWRFRVAKAALYPLRPLPRGELLARVANLDARLRDVARRHRAVVIEPPLRWYAGDGIHVRRARRAAWAAALCGPLGGNAGDVATPSLPRGLQPELRTLVGLPLRTPQPVLQLADGSALSLF